MLIKKITALILLIVGLSFLLSFVSSLDFSRTGLEGFIGEGVFEKRASSGENEVIAKKVPSSLVKADMCSLKNDTNPPQVPIFFVEGLNSYTNHLRLYTSSTYDHGVWIEDTVEYNDKQELTISFHSTRYKVTPIIEFKSHVPVAKDTVYVSLYAKYNRSSGVYYIDSCKTPYFAVSTAHSVDVTDASDEGFANISMDRSELNAIKKLALAVTKDAKTDYEKVKMIEKFLKTNYAYDPSYTIPENVDPVYWFLFKEKKGICKHFASAFVIMCNSIGIPARAVVGYLAEPTPENQTVFASQAHIWAEVKFKEGWVEFDPTPSPKRISTITEITYVDEAVKKGENFTVEGFVKTIDKSPVENGFVEIYLKKSKNDKKGILLDLVYFENGHFKADIPAPDLAGEFHVVAHYVGSLKYMESWSDPTIKIYSPPHFDVEIPDKVSTRLVITGRLLDYNGTGIPNADVIVRVDGVTAEKAKTDENGNFTAEITLDKGYHEIELYYPGSEFILPVSFKKKVEAGDVKVVISNTTVLADKNNNVSAIVLFNEKPLSNARIEIAWNNESVIAYTNDSGVLSFSITPRSVGILPIEFVVLGYREVKTLKSVAETNIEASYDGVLRIRVTDSLGNDVSGIIYVNGKKFLLRNGTAEIKMNGSRFEVYYPGDEFHLPARKIVDVSGFPLWISIIPIALAMAGVYLMLKRERIKIIIEKEMDDLPLIWRVGEEIRFRVECRDDFRVYVDGKPFDGNILRFDKEGEHVLRVERIKNGDLKEAKEVKIKIVDDYGKAIVEVFKELVNEVEKARKVNLRDATAREILELLQPCKAPNLLRLFELYRYGSRRGFTRSDFVESFKAYLELRRCIYA
jgi:hypothetical protein